MADMLNRLGVGQKGGAAGDGRAARPLGDLLVSSGAISAMQLEIALKAQKEAPGRRLGDILVDKGFLSQERLREALERQHNETAAVTLPDFPVDMRDIAAYSGGTLYVLDGRQGLTVVQSWLAEARRAGAQVRIESCAMELLTQMRSMRAVTDAANLSAQRAVRRIVAQAVAEKASDIHLSLRSRPGGAGYMQVHFRIKGSLEKRMQFTETEGAQMIRAMFQGMAAVADANFRETEDQHAVITNPVQLRNEAGEALSISGLRLAKAPLHDGMNCAVRLLYEMDVAQAGADLIGRLGYSRRQSQVLHMLARQTMGINLFTGPTGSGKSSTLASMIQTMLHTRPGSRIITIEDPVEFAFESDAVWQYKIANANTDEEKNRAFSGKLKTALRQDPDIIMLGEIRGLETAKEAVNAAITGHQVWSTLHVSDPFMIASRLIAMGIDGFYLQDPKMLSSLNGQRLIKTLCPHCAAPAERAALILGGLDPEDWDHLATWASDVFPLDGVRMRGAGCTHCQGTGIQGRTVVAQVIPADEDLLVDMVNNGPMMARKHYLARTTAELPMEAHAALKILRGLTDPRFVVEMLGPIPARPANLRPLTEDDL